MTNQASGGGSGSVLEVFSQVSSIRTRTAGTFDAEISGEWTIAGKPNGGYLLALLGRAASSLTDSGHVIAASAHYVRSPDPGPVEIEGELLRRGRSISQVRARMSQGGRPCVESVVSTSELDPSTAPHWDAGVLDGQVVSFDDCIRLKPVTPDGSRVAMFDQVDARLDPEWSGVTNGRASGRGQLRGWLKLPGEESFDPISLLYAVDALPPPTFDTDFMDMVSTAELTVYVRAIPAPGPVRIVTRARLIDPRWVDHTCDVWDGTGRLVAQATQLAKRPFG
jgi:Acyl-CoA thioesterase C-terminal domain/Acyl-CoA thioesterase N-terminal domain